MNEKICFLILIIAYAIYHSQREIFFNIVYTLSFIELTYKCLSHKIINDLLTFRKTVMYYFSSFFISYYLIKDPNPFYHLFTFYLPFQNFFRGIFILSAISFSISKLTNESTFLFKSLYATILSSYKKLFISLIALILLHFAVYLYDIKFFLYFSTPKYISENPNRKYYICANLLNNADILPDWLTQMKLLISYLGASNVYVSIFENGDSKDSTGAELNKFSEYLTHLNVPNKIVTTKQIVKGDKERIVFLAELRNKALEFLYEIPNVDYNNTSILFFNDIIFNYADIIKLISTNDGDYDAVCGMDYYESFYDTWVSIGLDGEEFRHYFPFFINKVAQDIYINGETLRTFSCWNGVIAIKALPFMDKKIEFRSGVKRRESECTLMNADLYTNGYGKVLVNTQLVFAYEYGYYYKNKYVYPWSKNLLTYFYYYFVYGFRKHNKDMSDLGARMGKFTKELEDNYEKYYKK